MGQGESHPQRGPLGFTASPCSLSRSAPGHPTWYEPGGGTRQQQKDSWERGSRDREADTDLGVQREPGSHPPRPSLLTGKYLENHGVIHNMWFNTSTGVKMPYYVTQGIDSWWDNGSLPIWITAQRQASGAGSSRTQTPRQRRLLPAFMQ